MTQSVWQELVKEKGKEGCNYGSIEYLQSGEDTGGADE